MWHLPGNRPEDEAWDNYWEDTERPETIYAEIEGLPKMKPEDLYDLYETNKEYEKAIEKDFQDWQCPDDYDGQTEPEYEDEFTDSNPWEAGPEGDLRG